MLVIRPRRDGRCGWVGGPVRSLSVVLVLASLLVLAPSLPGAPGGVAEAQTPPAPAISAGAIYEGENLTFTISNIPAGYRTVQLVHGDSDGDPGTAADRVDYVLHAGSQRLAAGDRGRGVSFSLAPTLKAPRCVWRAIRLRR